jgi:AraC family transcriptional regulator, regulatory protein of adaptative response / DNA-3-methyladenine glycosylase II
MLAAFGLLNRRCHESPKTATFAFALGYSQRVEFSGLDTRTLDRARISRDARFDGKFFIAVTSTKIYCRPICPVRSPKRSNIRYYPTAAAAAEAGFRPCLRCRPEAAPDTPAWIGTLSAVRRGLRLIQDGFLDIRNVQDLANHLGIGARHLHRLFVHHVGASPIALAQTRRIHFAKRLLDETSLPITEIAMAAGFGSVRRFNDVFRRTYKRPPRDVRKPRAGEVPTDAVEAVVLRLAYRPPYDRPHLHDFLAARAIPGIEVVEGQSYSRTVSAPNSRAIVQIRWVDGKDAVQFLVMGANPADLLHLSTVARRVFDLAADPEMVASAFRDDSLLGGLVRRRPGLRIPGVWSPFECAVRAVVGQQVTVGAARTFLTRLVERFGVPVSTHMEGLTRLFPSPESMVQADLGEVGLTRNRAATLKELAIAFVEKRVDFNQSTDDVIRNLSCIKGIGRWTADYIALRGLGEPDAFPSGDIVLRRVCSNGNKLISASALEQRAEAWRPWRGYATIYLWSERATPFKKLLAS